jgi:hypothetical protein
VPAAVPAAAAVDPDLEQLYDFLPSDAVGWHDDESRQSRWAALKEASTPAELKSPQEPREPWQSRDQRESREPQERRPDSPEPGHPQEPPERPERPES